MKKKMKTKTKVHFYFHFRFRFHFVFHFCFCCHFRFCFLFSFSFLFLLSFSFFFQFLFLNFTMAPLGHHRHLELHHSKNLSLVLTSFQTQLPCILLSCCSVRYQRDNFLHQLGRHIRKVGPETRDFLWDPRTETRDPSCG